MQAPFLFDGVFALAHPLAFTTKSTKDTKLKNGINRFVLFVSLVVKKKNANNRLHLRELRCCQVQAHGNEVLQNSCRL